MKPIIAPIQPNASGTHVVNLLNALFVMLDRGIIRAMDAPDRPTLDELKSLTKNLKIELTQALFGEATYNLILIFQIQQGLGDNLKGVVEEQTAEKLNEILNSLGLFDEESIFVVLGTVRDSNGKPAANVTVRAFDRDLRREQRLGETVTDYDGLYEIRYTVAQFRFGDSLPDPSPDLLVRVVDTDDQTIKESPVLFNASQEEIIDLTVPAPPISEFERITAAISPVLHGQGNNNEQLQPWELNEEDKLFIIGETGLEHEQVRMWILAAKTAHETELIAPESSVSSSSSSAGHTNASKAQCENLEFIAYYGWFRDGQPQTFSALIQVPIDNLIASFANAIKAQYIPVSIKKFEEQLRTALMTAT